MEGKGQAMIKRFREIYDRLSDAGSKEIFEKRLMYSLTGDDTYLLALGNEFEKKVMESGSWREIHDKLVASGENVAMYSAGFWGRQLLERTKDIPWKCVIDANPKSDEFCGLPLVSFDDFVKEYKDSVVVISSRVYHEEIRDELIRRGVPVEKIVEGEVLFDLSEGAQYFDPEILPDPAGKEVFADVGCYDGLSAVSFDKWCKGNGYSYCFEPDGTNIDRIRRVLKNKGVDSYELIEKGVWSSTGRLGFVSTGNSLSHVSVSEDASDKTDGIDVVTLDEALGDKNVTFIKMDIEGAELEALKGAQKIIMEHKPKLAICVYHKPQDIWELPELILKYNSDYSFYLRHYSYWDNETVLYAI